MAERVEVIDVDFSKVTQEAESAAKSVDNLADSFDDLNKSSDKINSTLKETADSLDNISNNESKIQSLVDGLGGLADTASGIAGAFGAVEGAMNLMGVESEEITKSILKMQSIMAITDGFDAIGRGVKGFYEMTQAVKTSTIAIKTLSVAKKADAIITATLTKAVQGFTASTTAATVATKVLKTTLITSGIGAIIIGIGEAIGYVTEKISEWNSSKNGGTIGLDYEGWGRSMEAEWHDFEDAVAKGLYTKEEEINKRHELIQREVEIANYELDELRKQAAAKKEITDEDQEILDAAVEKRSAAYDKLFESQRDIWRYEVEERNKAVESAKASAKELQAQKDELKKIIDGYDELINNYGKSEGTLFEEGVFGDLEAQTANLKKALDMGIISEQTYNNRVAQLNMIATDKINKYRIEKEKETEEEMSAILEEALVQRFDSITNELDTRMQNLYDEYNLKITEAETQGKTIEAAQLKIELLKEEAALLEEIKGKYQDVGGVSGVKGVDSASKQNKANTISAEGGLFDAKVGAITESLTAVADTANEIISIGDGIDSAWGNVFSNMINGVDKVSKSLKSGEKGWKTYGSIMNSTLSVGASIMNALANEQDADTKEGFERQKKFQIAGATMSMLSGIMDAWSGAMQLGPIMGPIVGGINSAMIATLGAIQIAKIKATQFEGGGSTTDDGSGGGAASATPALTALQSMQSGVGITTNVQGASTEGQVTDTRVYVLESDIANTTRKVNVAESEATF